MSSTTENYKSLINFPIDVTCPGCCIKGCLYVPINNKELSSKLCNDIKSIEDSSIRDQATNFCDLICQYLYHHEFVKLPNLYFSLDEDGAFFEWIFDNFRFGFLFCSNSSESGWYLISKVSGAIERFNSTFHGKETIEYIFGYISVNA